MKIKKTEFSRKLDNLGRIVIPSKLRLVLGIAANEIKDFYIIEENNDKYLAIKL